MKLTMEALLPLVADLTDRYTSKESSSVTYETANMLMSAVIYCIRECEEEGDMLPAAAGAEENWRSMYRRGYERVLEKTYQAKEIYEQILADFESYRCQNYRDTIVKGIPAFFVKYDPRFCPQDHLLTLDYPALLMDDRKRGVDLILSYLKGIRTEQVFLSRFPRSSVIQLLEHIQPEYESLYLDNICEIVLLRAIGCAIAGKPVGTLRLDLPDIDQIMDCFATDGKAEIQEKLGQIIVRMDPTGYLAVPAAGFAARIEQGMKHHRLDGIF